MGVGAVALVGHLLTCTSIFGMSEEHLWHLKVQLIAFLLYCSGIG